MKPCNLLLVLFFLLMPNQQLQNSALKGVSCDYAPNYDPRKRSDSRMIDYNTPDDYSKKRQEGSTQDTREPLPVRIRYEPTMEETCESQKRESAKECERREMESVKKAGAKCHAEKPRRQEQGTCKATERIVKVDFAKPEVKCSGPTKRGSILCADCEECELQVKANNEGVLLRCKNCRETPSNEVIFPAGSNRKIISLP